MNITYAKNKTCDCLKNLVEHPEDRGAIKAFTKHFCNDLIKPTLKLHKRLSTFSNVQEYNRVFIGDNAVQQVKAIEDKQPLVLKVRITDAYRKFFYYVSDFQEDFQFVLTKDWKGNYQDVTNIHVYEVNKHEYNKAKNGYR